MERIKQLSMKKLLSTNMQAHQSSERTVFQEEPENLPQEIIVEILSWLPVKSLLKFRCVSKLWCSLISNPHFTKVHLTKSTTSNNHASHSLLLTPIDAPTELYTCSVYSVLYEKSPVNPTKVQLRLQSTCLRLGFLGSCNGLFCISEGSFNLVLLNPSTRKSKILPNSGIDMSKFRYLTYGFGYDQMHDDYKVVEIGCFCHHGMEQETMVNVYSLRTNSWRRIQDYQGGFISAFSGVYVNGGLHWLVIFRGGSRFSWSIVSLDLATETYGEIMQPSYEKGKFGLNLGVLEGCLCVFCDYGEVGIDVWMMKEYGVKKSWTKLVSIIYSTSSRGRPSPLFVSEADEILLDYNYSLMLYNWRDDKFRNCDLRNLGSSLQLGAVGSYIESLISPHLFDEVSMMKQAVFS